jgi:hypothetical protein
MIDVLLLCWYVSMLINVRELGGFGAKVKVPLLYYSFKCNAIAAAVYIQYTATYCDQYCKK